MTNKHTNPRPAKLGDKKLTPEEQRRRSIEAAFDANLERIARAKAPASSR